MAAATAGGSARKELQEQFCAITGATTSIAQHFLDACKGDLQMAIGMHMDSDGGVPSPAQGPRGNQGNQQRAPIAADTPEDVREPIPQKHETLVEDQYAFGIRGGGRKRPGRSVFDGFRDFQAETRQQELALAGQPGTSAADKRKTLEDLFRPPIDLLHKGTFLSAREEGTVTNKWMLINIQNVQEFACQVLNRDVWSHPAVKDLVQAHFVFWQVYSDSEEGKKFMQFYKIKKWPYIAVLDPRTGENLVTWNSVDSLTFCDLVTEFVAEHPSPDGSTPTKGSPPHKRAKRSSIVDASEDSQLEAAIQASITATKPPPQAVVPSSDQDSNLDETDDDLETFSDSEDEASQHSRKSAKKAVTFANQSESSCEAKLVSEVNGKANKTHCSLSQQSSTSSTSSQNQTGSSTLSSQGSTSTQGSTASTTQGSTTSTTQGSTTSGHKTPPGGSTISGGNHGNSDKAACANSGKWKEYLGAEEDPHANLLIRFPDGKRTPLKIPGSSKLMALVQFVIEEGYSNERYELVTNYPRRKLSYLDFDHTLKDLGLFPQETVFVQER